MRKALVEFESNISKFLLNEITADQLEQCSMDIIANDEFTKLPESIQDLVYAIDNKELDELNKAGLKELRDKLREQL